MLGNGIEAQWMAAKARDEAWQRNSRETQGNGNGTRRIARPDLAKVERRRAAQSDAKNGNGTVLLGTAEEEQGEAMLCNGKASNIPLTQCAAKE